MKSENEEKESVGPKKKKGFVSLLEDELERLGETKELEGI